MSDFDWGVLNGLNLGLSFAALVSVIIHVVGPVIGSRRAK